MNKDILITAAIDKRDPHSASKQLQLIYWWHAFSVFLFRDSQERLKFFSEILLDDECWKKTEAIPHIKLNRRMVARKMIHSHSRTGKTNPLSDHERYQIACGCCLEEDIAALFEQIKQHNAINAEDTTALKELVETLSKDVYCKKLMTYWSHVVSGNDSELILENKHLYEYGLDSALDTCKHVEAIEFFWNKIKSLPEDKLSYQRKREIFVATTVGAVKHFDIFEFCIGQVSSNMYPEILKRDFARNGIYGSFDALIHPCHFDQTKTLFDCLMPDDISEHIYGHLLQSLSRYRHPTHYTNEAVELFVHVWMKEGFRRHRAYVLEEKKIDFCCPRSILMPLVEQNYMEIIWAVFDKTSPHKMKMFIKSRQSGYIRNLLEIREDIDSLKKLLSYKNSATVPVKPNANPTKPIFKTPSKK